MTLLVEKDHETPQARIARLEARLAEQAARIEALAAEARMFRAALESIGEGVMVSDLDGNIVHRNPAADHLLGARVQSTDPERWPAGYGLYQLDGVTLLSASEIPLVRAVRGETVEGLEICARSENRPDGIWLECNAWRIHDETGALCGAVIVFRDITERRRWRAEKARRQQIEMEQAQQSRILRHLLDNLDITVWAVDESGIFTFLDGRALRTAGLASEELLGRSAFDLHAGTKVADGIRDALAGAANHVFTEAHGLTWENWHIPVRTENGEVHEVIGLSLDVTETHRAKKELLAKLALIERQQEVIRNLETPVIQVWDQVLTLPMVGVVDSRRAALVMDDLLAAVSRTQARYAILDLTGVEVVDTATASHLLCMIRAVRLLGAEGVITGIRPTVAQTVVTLGLDLSQVITMATLRDGLRFCIRRLGGKAS